MAAKKKSDEEAIREAMEAEGVPAAVIEHVLAQKPVRWIYWVGAWSFLVVMVGGFGVGAVLWGAAETAVDSTAIARARELHGLLYATNFGIGFIALLFGWIFLSGGLVTAIAANWPRVRASFFAYTLQDQKNKLSLTMGGRLKKLAEETDADAYVRKAIGGSNKIFLWAGLFLSAIGAAVVERELNTYEIYTAEIYLATPLLPWDTEKSRPWRNADHVELGCNHITGKNASDDIIYEVAFPDGRKERISSAKAVDGNWLDNIEKLDAALRADDISFQRWRWRDRDPLHPACLAAQGRRHTRENYERIKRLLRVGEFPTDH